MEVIKCTNGTSVTPCIDSTIYEYTEYVGVCISESGAI